MEAKEDLLKREKVMLDKSGLSEAVHEK